MLRQYQHPLFHDLSRAYGPQVNDARIAAAESTLGRALPEAYRAALRLSNGGLLRRRRMPTGTMIHELIGVTYDGSIDSDEGSRFLSLEWGLPYPSIIFFAQGPVAAFLDLRDPTTEEPPIVWVDTDRGLERRLADSFADLVDQLRYPTDRVEVALLGGGTEREMLDMCHALGGEGPVRQDWTGARSLRLEMPGRGPGPTLLRLRPNRWRGLTIVPELDECDWVIDADIEDVAIPEWLSRVSEHAPDPLLIGVPWRK
ncbi:MAG: SMI1/KNR4 family protein [Myxococcota bacterium]